MPKSELSDEPDFRPAEAQAAATNVLQLPAAIAADPVNLLGAAGFLGTRDEIEQELDVIAGAIRTFYSKQPDQVMRECAAYSARLTELAVLLHRVEASNRLYTRIRTQQVQRYIDEVDRQFKMSSRMVEMLRLDLELLR